MLSCTVLLPIQNTKSKLYKKLLEIETEIVHEVALVIGGGGGGGGTNSACENVQIAKHKSVQ